MAKDRRHRLLLAILGLLLALVPLLAPAPARAGGPVLEVFVREGCPHCAQAEQFLPELRQQRPDLQVRLRRLEADPAAIDDLLRASSQAGIQAPGVPTFVIAGQVLVGFDGPAGRGRELLALVDRQAPSSAPVRLGPLGALDVGRLGLPLFTLVLGLLDGFNPCAMWVLLFLLSLLVHWRDRRRLALVAGTFVLVSGAVYYAFMAAWLNVFLLLGFATWLRLLLGALALLVGGVNLLEFWREGSRFTLSIPDSAKPGLYERMRAVTLSRSLLPALTGVAALAVVVNGVELLCTAGFPAVYTAVLSQQQLSPLAHYGYLGLYIVGYIADDALMVSLAVLALGSQRLTERAGRWLKLISGGVMVALALVLLLRPGWLL
ncbi:MULTISPECIES: glutaredoxin family protein [Aphanothece]|uniref:glutaredoxin family protein n=1 Tax=Aphanothece TaxID=1121 RepID=UPI0039849894